ASLEDSTSQLGAEPLQHLYHPPQTPLKIDSPSIQQSITMYLALEHSSQKSYKTIHTGTKQNFVGAEGVEDILSFWAVKRLIAEYTGVESIKHNMCPNMCLAYTGPFADL
ncbi:hypothetical protein PAXRUDRAFT_72882, partial [Paxillus rubicundulus Ve08.2h10]